MRSINTILACLVVITLVLGSAGCQIEIPSRSGEDTSVVAQAAPRPSLDSFVSVTGKVLPLEWAAIGFSAVGNIAEVRVEEGDRVVAGQILALLDLPELSTAVANAEAGVQVARAQLARVEAPARPEEVQQAELAVSLAEEGVSAAQIGVATAAANRLAAEAALDAAKADLARLKTGATADELEVARQRVEAAKALLYSAQGNRDAVGGRKNKSGYQAGSYEAAEGQVMSAETNVTIARLNQRILEAGARAEDIARADAQVSRAHAGVEAALTQERAARQAVANARLQVAQARTQLDLVRAGAREEDRSVARSQLAQAEAGLQAAKAAAEKAQLVAPFDGTIAEVNIRTGEYATVGVPAMAIGDISSFRVEITDLDEIDVARIATGRRAKLTFDALPDVELEGTVDRIALKASAGAGGTAYKTLITFAEHEPRLRWGMTAFADIDTE
jgi:HlyD family secretion protein